MASLPYLTCRYLTLEWQWVGFGRRHFSSFRHGLWFLYQVFVLEYTGGIIEIVLENEQYSKAPLVQVRSML